MNVALGFHFRDDGERGKIFEAIRERVESLYPFDEVLIVDSGHQPYNRAASRNLIVKRAIESDVVVVCDADSIPEEKPLREAIDGAYGSSLFHIPFQTVRVLSSSRVRRLPDNLKSVREIYRYGPSFGGCYVVRPQLWWDVGGMDERIVGWGYEDEIFLVATTTFSGKYVSHPGNLYTFNHSRGPDLDSRPPNGALRDSYNENIGNKEKIREIQRFSNDWNL
jgi:hypothetical protein